ncbi:unnamed protein product [Candidula unifasciata]|uniref:AB hydrolase-1 domain-containing protein n=1 Tax=Candidula unifasciata TaxID=100452 RepID=A0A8S3ZVP8_9EUPU|nr:unnamed protein product [Candidula unifasciata]
MAADNLEALPELTEEKESSLKKEAKKIDIKVGDTVVKIHVEQVVKDSKPKLDVLFLHGASFSSQNWLDIKSLEHVASWGYRAIAIDLPGGNKSPVDLSSSLKGKFLDEFIRTMEMKNIVIIAPSASGSYALPYLFNGTSLSIDSVLGFVPMAPVGTSHFREKFTTSKVQTLIVYGSKDTQRASVFLPDLELIPNHTVAKIEDAGHACYLNKPEAFHKVLFHFLKNLAP